MVDGIEKAIKHPANSQATILPKAVLSPDLKGFIVCLLVSEICHDFLY